MSRNPIQAIRGMPDILPESTPVWQVVEVALRRMVEQYGYDEIRLPILEQTQLFARSIGDVTDIVEKEMYTFDDRNGDSLSLRPEGTAGCVRACLQHGLLNQSQKLWYLGPMYRHERPQKGRYRQFYQFGLEAFGYAGPEIEVELMLFGQRLWAELGLDHKINLTLNTLGTASERAAYRKILINYFKSDLHKLDADSQRRLDTNPLRILDSKNPEMAELIQAAPKLQENLGAESRAHFSRVIALLTNLNIKYTINPCLVRGLDYYSQTVFEWVTDDLGAQGTVCAGGRYDSLVTQLGGKPMPAVGLALGLERLILLLNQTQLKSADIYLITEPNGVLASFKLAEQLRSQQPNLMIIQNHDGGSFKSQFKRADKSGANIALILGESELTDNTVSIKYLREDKPQETVPIQTLLTRFNHE